MNIMAFDIGLALLVLVVGASIIFARDAVQASVVFVAYGLLLAVVWVRLSAVDVALTEAAIGGGMTGMLLIGAALRPGTARSERAGLDSPTRLVAGILCAMVAAGVAVAVVLPPEIIPTLAPTVMKHLPQTGLGNPVAAVLFAYRALDTLLEKVVLLVALLGTWSLATDGAWNGTPGLQVYSYLNVPLRFLAQLLPPIGIVVAIYMCWVGAKDPGGAFQGGTVLAAMWLLVIIAGLERLPSTSARWLRHMLVIGPVVFLTIGFAGLVFAGAFLAYPVGYAKPMIVVIEFALMISIAAVLTMLAAGPSESEPQP